MGKPAINTEGIISFIKSSKEPVNKKQILEATNYPGDYKYAMRVILKEHDDIERVGDRFNACYQYNPKTVENEKEVSVMKNHEGYNDRTAGRAIANVMNVSDGKYPSKSFGEVYEFKPDPKVKKKADAFLVISCRAGSCIGYNVFFEPNEYMREGYTLRWRDAENKTYWVSTLGVINIAARSLLDKPLLRLNESEKECVRTSLLNALGIVINVPKPEVKVEVVKDPITEKKLAEAISQCDNLLDQNEKLSKEVENLKKSASDADLESAEYSLKQAEEIEELKRKINEKDKEIELAVLQAKCDVYEKLLFDKGNPYYTRIRSAS